MTLSSTRLRLRGQLLTVPHRPGAAARPVPCTWAYVRCECVRVQLCTCKQTCACAACVQAEACRAWTCTRTGVRETEYCSGSAAGPVPMSLSPRLILLTGLLCPTRPPPPSDRKNKAHGPPQGAGAPAPHWQGPTVVRRHPRRRAPAAVAPAHTPAGPGRPGASRVVAGPPSSGLARAPPRLGERLPRCFTMHLVVSLFLFTRQDRYDCGPPTPFNSPAQEVPQQRTRGPSERVTPVLT